MFFSSRILIRIEEQMLVRALMSIPLPACVTDKSSLRADALAFLLENLAIRFIAYKAQLPLGHEKIVPCEGNYL